MPRFRPIAGVVPVAALAVFLAIVAPGCGRLAGSTTARPGETPVVLVVFEGLPLVSFLDADHLIDPWHFPNLWQLARDGVWYRHATTVSDVPARAVRSILSGQYPRDAGVAATMAQPDTLFTLVGDTHRLVVSETTSEGGAGGGGAGLGAFQRFLDAVTAEDPQPAFYYLRTSISLPPYDMLPDGRRNATRVDLPGPVDAAWDEVHVWTVAQNYQRHLLHMGFVDHLIGQLVKRLEAAGLYERALVIVTSDRGVSHTPGTPQRQVSGRNAAEILRIPLVVKPPARFGLSRKTSGVNAEAVDILPTVADVLDVDVPWTVDGASLIDTARVERPRKLVFAGTSETPGAESPEGPDDRPALRRKFALFGGDRYNAHRAPTSPRFGRLIGRALEDLRVADGGEPVELLHAGAFAAVDPDAPAAVFDVGGRFATPHPEEFVAVAVNGVVEAVTQTWQSDPRGWLATPRFDAWQRGPNVVEVFVLERDEEDLLLRRSPVTRPAGP